MNNIISISFPAWIVNTLTATTNVRGEASVLIRARPTAQPQPAILQVVDPGTGLVRRFVFSIGLSNEGNSNNKCVNVFLFHGISKQGFAGRRSGRLGVLLDFVPWW